MSNKPSKIRLVIAANLRKFREKRKLTQTELAEAAGLNPHYYPRVERGEINSTVDQLDKLVEALKIKWTELVSS